MNYDDYMKRIQYISNILEKNDYAENILNSKEVDVAQDFQYICLCSASNYKVVNEVIARLAQNGNGNIVEENVKIISMSMWKDLFNKNEAIKKIFIKNYPYILENNSVLTIREIEQFINDKDTCELIYNTLNIIIKKLCTYDRASLIFILKSKENGVEKIRENLEVFFQKGEFDITTTYSKILYELSQIPQINKLEILKAFNNNLIDMLDRETAVDNETNQLLNWVYDAYEGTEMPDNEKAIIKENINKAILENFDNILYKSNYDKNTIKILKQFDCTKERFEKNKNNFIEKSNRSSNEYQSLNLNVKNGCNYFEKNGDNTRRIDKLFENAKKQVEKENVTLNNEIIEEKKNKVDENNTNDFQNKIDSKHQEQISEVSTTVATDSLINTYINEFAKKKENIIATQNLYKSKEEQFSEEIKKIATSHIEEADKIIDKVLKRNKAQVEVTCNSDKINKNINDTKNNANIIDKVQDINNKDNESFENSKSEDIKLQTNQSTELIVKSDVLNTPIQKHIIKKIWRKITKLFKSKSTIEKIGD